MRAVAAAQAGAYLAARRLSRPADKPAPAFREYGRGRLRRSSIIGPGRRSSLVELPSSSSRGTVSCDQRSVTGEAKRTDVSQGNYQRGEMGEVEVRETIASIPMKWVGRLIGFHGSRVKAWEALSGCKFAFDRRKEMAQRGEGEARMIPVKVIGYPSKIAVAKEIVRAAVQMEGLRDQMKRDLSQGKHRSMLFHFTKMRRLHHALGTPLIQIDYNMSIKACGMLCMAEMATSSFRHFCLLVSQHVVDVTVRSWAALCETAVDCGTSASPQCKMRHLLAMLRVCRLFNTLNERLMAVPGAIPSTIECLEEGLCEADGFTKEEAIGILEHKLTSSKANRLLPALQMIIALHDVGRPLSPALTSHAIAVTPLATDYHFVHQCLRERLQSRRKLPHLPNRLGLRMAIAQNHVEFATSCFVRYCSGLKDGEPEACEGEARDMLSNVLQTCAWWRRMDLAEDCWAAYQKAGLATDVRAYSSYILAASNCGKFGTTFAALQAMRDNVSAEVSYQLCNVVTQSASRSAAKASQALAALRELAAASPAKPVPAAALTVCVVSAGRVKGLKHAVEIYEEFSSRLPDLTGSLAVLNALLSTCALRARLDAAEATFTHAKACGLEPNAQSYAHLVVAALRADNMAAAEEYARQMDGLEVEPSGKSHVHVAERLLALRLEGRQGAVAEHAVAL